MPLQAPAAPTTLAVVSRAPLPGDPSPPATPATPTPLFDTAATMPAQCAPWSRSL